MRCVLNYTREILHDIYLVEHSRFLTELFSYTWFPPVTNYPSLLHSLLLIVTQSQASFILSKDFYLCLKSHSCFCGLDVTWCVQFRRRK